jgi:glycosyltransferase involved in cell wall biosynthesis
LHAWKQTTQKHPNAHLLILGEGGAFRNVEDEVRQLAIDLHLSDTVHFLGRINDVNPYLLAGDIFVLPSSSEGMSNALLEAMAAGLGIVASNIPGNAQLIADGINGLLVPPGDVSSLSLALNCLLTDSALTAKLGKAAKQSAIENFSIDSVADRYINLYTELLQE